MAESKTGALVFFLVALVVAAASAGLAAAAAAESKCDEKCLIERANEEYAAAKPAEKKAVASKLRKQFEGAAVAVRSPQKGAELTANCISSCANESTRCGGKDKKQKDPACIARCESACRAEVDSLTFGNDLYKESGDSEMENLIEAVRKQEKADAPGEDMLDALSDKCVDDCMGNSCPDPACTYECINGCYARYLSFVFAMATPAKRDAIFNQYLDNNVRRAAALLQKKPFKF